ncbi:Com family DNA-binding transcriptional regulator [Undibacterium sp. SXout11W]|uniref:Com family DNA-binding transcriptional regulator n=1 Tax=Undibacterium sp. SXout11W TaxID=3413050 RepID=UPI003BF07664
MKEIRCGNCYKKLGTGEYTTLNVKCPRCKALNQLSAASTIPERPGAPSGVKQYDKSDSSMDGRQAPISR